MKLVSSFAATCLAVAVPAQTQVLNINPTGASYAWTPAPVSAQNFFDLTVTNQVTLQAIDVPLLNPAGTVGTIEIYLTNPGTTTHVGNEVNAGVWTLQAAGSITAKGTVGTPASLSATSCQMAIAGGGLVLNPGTYGVAVRYVGVAPVLIAVSGAPTYSDPNLTVSNGTTQYTAFVSAPPAPVPGSTGWSIWGALSYAVGSVPHACAQALKYGIGCNTVSGSTAEEWTDATPGGAAPSASAALTGRKIQFAPSAGGYLVLPGTAAFLPPSGTATALPATDDSEAAITPSQAFPYPGGAATQLFVHSNGYVSVGSNDMLPGGPNWVPQIPAMLSATNTAWWAWHDHNPTEPGSGLIVWEEVGGLIVITYNDVESYPVTAVNRSTVQFQFDPATGTVTMIFQVVDALGGSGFLEGDDWIVGYSPGGPSPSAIPLGITTLASLTLPFPEVFPLDLNTAGKPLLGTTFHLVTSQQKPLSLGINFVSLVAIPAPGLDLGVLGMPGCVALLDINAAVGNVISDLGLPGLSMTIPFPLPSNPLLAGAQVASQSVWLDPLANPFGAVTSPGILMTVGSF